MLNLLKREDFYLDERGGDVLWMTDDGDHVIYLPFGNKWLCIEMLNHNWPALTVGGPYYLEEIQLWALHRAATNWNIRRCSFDEGVMPGFVGERLDEFDIDAVSVEWKQKLGEHFGEAE